jgi:hypothetical protein
MQELTAKLNDQTSNRYKPYRSSDKRIALHLCYGEIGIPAVAAAARYLKDARAYSPAVIESEYRVAAIA